MEEKPSGFPMAKTPPLKKKATWLGFTTPKAEGLVNSNDFMVFLVMMLSGAKLYLILNVATAF